MSNFVIKRNEGELLSPARAAFGVTTDIVAAGLASPIRSLRRPADVIASGFVGSVAIPDDRSFRRYLVASEVAKLARAAGARHNVPADVMIAAVDLVTLNFSFLGVKEIAEAFRLAVAGTIFDDRQKPINMAMYGGAFNVVYLGEILRAYRRHRAEVRRAIDKLETEAKAEAKRLAVGDELRKKSKSKLISFICEYFADIASAKEPARVLMSFHYDMTARLASGFAFTPDEKRAAMRSARTSIASEMTTQKNAVRSAIDRRRIAAKVEAIVGGEESGAVKSRAKTILLKKWLEKLAADGLSVDELRALFDS